jgi:hypothetical protein
MTVSVGYHHGNYAQLCSGWDNQAWDNIDFYTFGKHFKRLQPTHGGQH